jgi:coiled-coil domain-containing protein 61
MLVSSLKRTSDSVSIDLLTYSDLEVLKAKRLRRSGHDVALPANTVVNNKRYLILTYQGEFDKVHYPLPLPFVEHPDPAELKKTIVRLRGMLPSLF